MFRTAFIASLAAAVLAPAAAQATNFIETADFSNDPAHPTVLGDLTPGSNQITGVIDTFGPRVGPHGERTNPDMDYVTFVVPTGERLTKFIVSPGTSILTAPRADRIFLGLASGDHVSVDPSFTSAAGLLGWTLVTQAQLGTNILPAIGAATAPGFPVPGATTFTGPLGSGTYSLWLVDGDEAATYSFNAVTAAVPEPATWAMLLIGFGAIGIIARRRQTHVAAGATGRPTRNDRLPPRRLAVPIDLSGPKNERAAKFGEPKGQRGRRILGECTRKSPLRQVYTILPCSRVVSEGRLMRAVVTGMAAAGLFLAPGAGQATVLTINPAASGTKVCSIASGLCGTFAEVGIVGDVQQGTIFSSAYEYALPALPTDAVIVGAYLSVGAYSRYYNDLYRGFQNGAPADKRSAAGRLTASGKVLVNVIEDAAAYGIVLDGSEDEAAIKRYAQQITRSMISENSELLSPVESNPNGPRHVKRDDGESPPWDGDGFPDTKDDDTAVDEPSRILSPDSGQTGGV